MVFFVRSSHRSVDNFPLIFPFLLRFHKLKQETKAVANRKELLDDLRPNQRNKKKKTLTTKTSMSRTSSRVRADRWDLVRCDGTSARRGGDGEGADSVLDIHLLSDHLSVTFPLDLPSVEPVSPPRRR